MEALANLPPRERPRAVADEKLAPLELLRGVAAFGVFAIHLLIGFAPTRSGYFAESAPTAAIGGILFAPYDGPALLAFFFLLSGFVLTRSVMNAQGTQSVVRGLLKRWPRLALLCLVSTILSWALWHAGLYFNAEAAGLSGSDWLAHHVVPGPPEGVPLTLWRAVRQGAYAVFASGEVWLNTSLWTMRIELLGSIVSIGLAPVFIAARDTRSLLALTAVLGFIFFTFQPFLVEFVVGTALACLVHKRRIRLRRPLARVVVGATLFLLVVNKPIGEFIGFDRLGPNGVHVAWLPVSALLVLAVLSLPSLAGGRGAQFARRLGFIAFPMYVLHIPVMCSLGSFVLIEASQTLDGGDAAVLASVVTVAATVLLAWPLGELDRWWVRRVGRLIARTLG
jgi:peptidoglycan/LPS O-acetylase OafA/YrhL